MKKKLLIVLLSLVMVFNTCGIVGYANDGITVTLNGNKIEFDVQPRLINDRTMVPLRKIFEAMGAYVDWYGDTQTVVATKDDKVVTAKIDDTKLYINDEVKTLDVPPMIIDGRTLVPARFVAESFGANVDWVEATQTVAIMTNDLFGKIDIQFIEGFELAKFSKYNSPASENGLGGTKIYLQAKLDGVDVVKTDAGTDIIYGFFTDNNGHRWYSTLNVTLFDDTSNYNNLIEKPLVVCGIYQGYSEKYKVPAFDMYKLMNLDTGDTKTGFAKINESLNIQSEKSNTDNAEDKVANYDFTSTTGIESYLHENYSVLDSAIGKWSFTFDVSGASKYRMSDFEIEVEYDLGMMNDLQYGTDEYSDSEIKQADKELKEFMKTLAEDLMDKIPDKKLQGSYHYSYYKYPNLKMDLVIIDKYSWANFDTNSKSSKVSTFRWLPNKDGRRVID